MKSFRMLRQRGLEATAKALSSIRPPLLTQFHAFYRVSMLFLCSFLKFFYIFANVTLNFQIQMASFEFCIIING